MAMDLFPRRVMNFFVAVLTVMAVVLPVKAVELDTIWREVPDTTVIKAQRPVVTQEHMKMREAIFFKIRESDANAAAGIDAAIRKVAGLMKASDDAMFTVTGYADRGTGNAEINKFYAQRRADDVTRKLINEHGLSPSRLKSNSKGDSEQPFAENDKNRCVIITGEGTFKVTRYEQYDSVVITTRRVMTTVVRETPAPVVTTERIARRELLSLKTNALLDLAYVPFGYNRWCPIPNVALEYYPKHGHFTYGASIDFPWWQHYWQHKYFEVRNYQIEARYYTHSGDIRKHDDADGMAFKGLYLQGYVHGGVFCFVFNADKGWIGEALGAGVGVGYVVPLSRQGRWRLELGLQIGFIYAGHDPFQYEYRGSADLQDHLYYYDWTLPSTEFKKRQYRYTWFGPTRAGITFSYDLLFRRKAKRGVSFRSYEVVERRSE